MERPSHPATSACGCCCRPCCRSCCRPWRRRSSTRLAQPMAHWTVLDVVADHHRFAVAGALPLPRTAAGTPAAGGGSCTSSQRRTRRSAGGHRLSFLLRYCHRYHCPYLGQPRLQQLPSTSSHLRCVWCFIRPRYNSLYWLDYTRFSGAQDCKRPRSSSCWHGGQYSCSAAR